MASLANASLGLRCSVVPGTQTPSGAKSQAPNVRVGSVRLSQASASRGSSRLYASQQEDFIGGAKADAQKAADSISGRAQEAGSDLSKKQRDVSADVRGGASEGADRVKETASGVQDKVKDASDDVSRRAGDVAGDAQKGLEDAKKKVEETGEGIGQKAQEAWDNIKGKGSNAVQALSPDWTKGMSQGFAAMVVAGALILAPAPQAEARSLADSLLISGRVQVSGPTETGKSGGATNLAARELGRTAEKGSNSNAKDGLRRETQLLSGQGENPLESAKGLLSGAGEDAGRAAKGALKKAPVGGAKQLLSGAREDAGKAAKDAVNTVRQNGPFSQAAPSYEVAGLFGFGNKSEIVNKGKEAQNAVKENVSQAADNLKGGANSIGDSVQRSTSEAGDKLQNGLGKPNADQGKKADNTERGSYQSAGKLAGEESKFSTPGGAFQADELLKAEKDGKIL